MPAILIPITNWESIAILAICAQIRIGFGAIILNILLPIILAHGKNEQNGSVFPLNHHCK